MNKKALFQRLLEMLAEQLNIINQSAHSAHSAATHPDAKPENKYDTRGLEASYLAGAQSRRANEAAERLRLSKKVRLEDFDARSQIGPTALVELSHGEGTLYVFLLDEAGPVTVEYDGKTIQTITEKSPLGQALVGQMVGDEIKVQSREYEITNVW